MDLLGSLLVLFRLIARAGVAGRSGGGGVGDGGGAGRFFAGAGRLLMLSRRPGNALSRRSILELVSGTCTRGG